MQSVGVLVIKICTVYSPTHAPFFTSYHRGMLAQALFNLCVGLRRQAFCMAARLRGSYHTGPKERVNVIAGVRLLW